MKRQPLTEILIAQRLCDNKKQAEALVMAGKVLVNGQPAKAGQLVRGDDAVRVKNQALPYASKGGLKLEGALAAFFIKPENLVCLDAGASTGGFTDCLLQHGARLVYAVDVGFGQLTGALRQHPRVINLERTNLGDASLLELSPIPTLSTCDLSYLSLVDAVPLYRTIQQAQGDLIALVKPLFEIDDPAARRSGEIPETAYQPLLETLAGCLNGQQDTRVMDVCASPVTGNAGTIEFFFHVRFGGNTPPPDLGQAIRTSVADALRTAPYRKAGDPTFGKA